MASSWAWEAMARSEATEFGAADFRMATADSLGLTEKLSHTGHCKRPCACCRLRSSRSSNQPSNTWPLMHSRSNTIITVRYTLFHHFFQLRNARQILLRTHTGKQAIVSHCRMGRDIKTG